jgi:hypothetical protein
VHFNQTLNTVYHTQSHHIQMACQEALTTGNGPVARQALTTLHALLVKRATDRAAAADAGGAADAAVPEADADADTAAPAAEVAASTDLPEGTVLRCLVKLGLEEVAAAVAPTNAAAVAAAAARRGPSSATAGAATEGGNTSTKAASGVGGGGSGGAADSLPDALNRLGTWLHLTAQRITKLGLAAFVGADAPQAAEHVAWFASAAWNAALDAAGERFTGRGARMDGAAWMLNTGSECTNHHRQRETPTFKTTATRTTDLQPTHQPPTAPPPRETQTRASSSPPPC